MTRLFEADHHILIHGHYANPIRHRHMSAHIILCPEGEMEITSEGNTWLCRGVLIPSGVSHSVDTFGRAALVFLYENTTTVARSIRHICPLAAPDCESIVGFYRQFQEDGDYRVFESRTLERLGLPSAAPCVTDGRILEAMGYIRAHLSEPITCREVAKAVYLSQSRFSHLFRSQVGMTFAAYLICQRLLCVYAGILEGRSITEAALAAGFSSSAHFADVNRRIFGLAASSITRDMIFRKVN